MSSLRCESVAVIFLNPYFSIKLSFWYLKGFWLDLVCLLFSSRYSVLSDRTRMRLCRPTAEDSGSSWSGTCTEKSSARVSGLDQCQTASHGSEAHCGSASALRLPQQPSQKGQIKGHSQVKVTKRPTISPLRHLWPAWTNIRWITRRLIWILMSVALDSGESSAARSRR